MFRRSTALRESFSSGIDLLPPSHLGDSAVPSRRTSACSAFSAIEPPTDAEGHVQQHQQQQQFQARWDNESDFYNDTTAAGEGIKGYQYPSEQNPYPHPMSAPDLTRSSASPAPAAAQAVYLPPPSDLAIASSSFGNFAGFDMNSTGFKPLSPSHAHISRSPSGSVNGHGGLFGNDLPVPSFGNWANTHAGIVGSSTNANANTTNTTIAGQVHGLLSLDQSPDLAQATESHLPRRLSILIRMERVQGVSKPLRRRHWR